MHIGSFIIDDTLTFYANSHTPSTGAAVDADADPGYRIYEDETGTPLLTGTLAKLDDANTTGFYSEQITLSSANGFEYGKSYCIRITLVVGGVTGVAIQRFQMGAKVDARLFGGTAGTFSGGRPEVNTSHVAGTSQTAGDIIGDTNDIQSRLPAALTANGNMKSSLLEIISTALSEGAAGRIAAAWQGMWNVTSPVSTAQSVNQTGDSFARLGAPAGASVSADVAAVKTDTGNLVTRITSTLFTGITSLAEWLGLIAGKQTGNSTARTEVRATGAGSGTYDETTDSLEASRDNIGTAGAGLTAADDAVITAIGALNNLSQANVRTAVGLASANLDTQLDALPTNSELATALAAADDAVLAAITSLQTAILAKLPAALTSDGNIKADALAINGVLAAAVRLGLSAGTMVAGTVDHAGFTATTTIFEADDITTAAADHYNGRTIIFTSGTLQYQATTIQDYALNGGRGRFTVAALTSAPADNVTFIII